MLPKQSPAFFLPLTPNYIYKEFSIPQDIQTIFEKTHTVWRFNHPKFPKHVFFDSVAMHSKRTAALALALPLSKEKRGKLARMLLIHDIPEVYTTGETDMTAIEKIENPILAEAVEQREEKFAKTIFSPTDFALYAEFNSGKASLKYPDQPVLSQDAIIGRILDVIDGNMCFHYFITKWIRSNKFLRKSLPHDLAFTFGFTFYEDSLSSLNKLKTLEKEIKTIALSLLNDHLTYILSCWKNIPPERIPESMNNQIQEYTTKINDLNDRLRREYQYR